MLALALIGIGVVWGVPTLLHAHEDAEYHSKLKEYGATVKPGVDLLLSSEKELKDPEGFRAQFSFKGSEEVRVDGARIYNDPASAGLRESSRLFTDEAMKQEGFAFLLCQVTIHNIDAVPDKLSVTKTGKPAFFFPLSVDAPFSEMVYFDDGTPDFTDEEESGYFNVQPGESKTITVGYAIHQDDASNKDLAMNTGWNKYRFLLCPQDMRKGE